MYKWKVHCLEACMPCIELFVEPFSYTWELKWLMKLVFLPQSEDCEMLFHKPFWPFQDFGIWRTKASPYIIFNWLQTKRLKNVRTIYEASDRDTSLNFLLDTASPTGWWAHHCLIGRDIWNLCEFNSNQMMLKNLTPCQTYNVQQKIYFFHNILLCMRVLEFRIYSYL